MRQINVLFGFAQEKTEESIIRSMNSMGLSVIATKKTKKGEIFEYLRENPDTDAVILKEYLDGGGELGTQDLLELSDDNRVNFVVVLNAKHRGRDEMRDIYAAGILNACFSDNRYGVNADELARLAVRSRTHKEAREYYRIESGMPNHRFLSYTEFKELYSYLLDEREGINISDRFITLSRWIDEEQLGSFVKMLPRDTKEALSAYKEFVEVNNRLYRLRYVDDKYPLNKTTEGLNRKEVAQKMLDESMGRTMRLPEPSAVDSSPEKEEEVQEEPVVEKRQEAPETEDDLRSMVLKARLEQEKKEAAVSEEETWEEEAGKSTGPELDAEDSGADAISPTAEQAVEKNVKKGLFSGLKEKLFNPDRGTVTVEEEPVSIEVLEVPVKESPVIDNPETESGIMENAPEAVVEPEDDAQGRTEGEMVSAEAQPPEEKPVPVATEKNEEATAPSREAPEDTAYRDREALIRAQRENELMKEKLRHLEERFEAYEKKEKKREDAVKKSTPAPEVKRPAAGQGGTKPEKKEHKEVSRKEPRAMTAAGRKDSPVKDGGRDVPRTAAPGTIKEGEKRAVKTTGQAIVKEAPHPPQGNVDKKPVDNKPLYTERKKTPVMGKNELEDRSGQIKNRSADKKHENAQLKGQVSIDDILNRWA